MKTKLLLMVLLCGVSLAAGATGDLWNRPSAPIAPSITQPPPAPGMNALPASAPLVTVPTLPGFEGPAETGWPGAAFRVPGPDRTARYVDDIGRVWYFNPKQLYMIEMPKSWKPPSFDEMMRRAVAQGYKPPTNTAAK